MLEGKACVPALESQRVAKVRRYSGHVPAAAAQTFQLKSGTQDSGSHTAPNCYLCTLMLCPVSPAGLKLRVEDEACAPDCNLLAAPRAVLHSLDRQVNLSPH